MPNKEIPYKIYLEESELPKQWYNVRADMKNKPAPLLNPATLKPMTFEDLRPVFCDELVRQELDDTTAYFDIPEEIQNFYKMYRPSPLVRAYCLEKQLDTPAKIYILCKETRFKRCYNRNRCWTVGNCIIHGLFLLRSGLQRLYGKMFL